MSGPELAGMLLLWFGFFMVIMWVEEKIEKKWRKK